MSLTDFSISVEPSEGFTKNDMFGQKAFGEHLANLLLNSSHPLTLAIDAQWGEGKTTFLKMWAGHLREEKGFSVIEFDAFANDYHDDPFIPLAGEVIALASRQKSPSDDFLNKAGKVGLAILKGAAKITAKAITLGVLDKRLTDEIAQDIGDGLADYTEKQVENLIKDHEKEKEQLEAFRESLKLLSLSLNSGPKNVDGSPINLKPLVFIIDELDRCRPDYALKLLERVKHFYSVPNVHFVFGVHMGQLENSVKSAYGSGINAKLYLQKFFRTLRLPQKAGYNRPSNISLYANKVISPKYVSRLKPYIITYLINNNASNRQIEHYSDTINFICHDNIGANLNIYLCFLAAVKIFDEDLYMKIINGENPSQNAPLVVRKFSDGKNGAELSWLIDYLSGTRLSDFHVESNKSIHEHFIIWENVIDS